MPRALLNTTTGSRVPVIYTVESVVGIGGANKREDVLLVQFFLRVAMDETKGLGREDRFLPPGENPISIDGRFGKQTAAYIKFFQEESSDRIGLPSRGDSRVEPFAGIFRGVNTGKLMTIVALNFDHLERRGTGFHSNLSIDSRFPTELKKFLFV
jgi:hypothetical protein